MRYFIFVLIFPAVILGCDPLANPGYGIVTLSTDTLYFDTVFTQSGSVTKEFRVINSGSEPLLIERIYLGGGEDSPFRLNINGMPGIEENGTVLAKGDSIFIFVDVFIDPTGDDSPVAVLDSVVFESGSYANRLILEAWGQDIWLLEDTVIGTATWTEGKPYVVKGSLVVDTAATLTLSAGTRVFFHHSAMMTVAGSLHSDGSAEKPVLFATDRLEKQYEDVPGRWRGINFQDCSINNIMNFTEIRNAEVSVKLSGSLSSIPDLKFNGARLMHNSVAALAAANARVFAVNSVFAHSGFSTVSLTDGGTYDFIFCTLVNRWEYGFRSEPVMMIIAGEVTMPDVSIANSVISGNLTNELKIEGPSGQIGNSFIADSSLIKVDTTTSKWYTSSLFISVETTSAPRFIDEGAYDYRPDTLSPLLERAGRNDALLWPVDIRNMPRPTGAAPDIGAYERQPGEKKRDEK
jgi:hypothetical protein